MKLTNHLLTLLRPRAAGAFDLTQSANARLAAYRALGGLTGLSILFTTAVYPLTGLGAPRDPLWTRSSSRLCRSPCWCSPT
jgi:hypothetical protein